MGFRSKRYQEFKGLVDVNKFYNIKEAVKLIKQSKKLKFLFQVQLMDPLVLSYGFFGNLIKILV